MHPTDTRNGDDFNAEQLAELDRRLADVPREYASDAEVAALFERSRDRRKR